MRGNRDVARQLEAEVGDALEEQVVADRRGDHVLDEGPVQLVEARTDGVEVGVERRVLLGAAGEPVVGVVLVEAIER